VNGVVLENVNISQLAIPSFDREDHFVILDFVARSFELSAHLHGHDRRTVGLVNYFDFVRPFGNVNGQPNLLEIVAQALDALP